MTLDANETLDILNKADLSNAFGQAVSPAQQNAGESLAQQFTKAVDYVDHAEQPAPQNQGPSPDTGLGF